MDKRIQAAATSFLGVLFITLTPVALFSVKDGPSDDSSTADGIPTVTLTLPNKTVTITGPPITISGPPVTITAPPGLTTRTVTVTVRAHPHRPRKTVYVHVPGPVRTTYIIQPKHTVTVRPHNTVVTQMVTITSHPTRQPGHVRGTVSPTPDPEVIVRTKTEVVVRKILVGTLVSIGLAVLGILALYCGYILGQKDSEKYQNKVLKGLIGRARGEHRHFSEEEH